MGNGLVSDTFADEGDDEEDRHPLSTYTEAFIESFPFYLSIGMTPEQYWDGDPELTRYYNQAHELKNDRKNQELWLQGLYIYAAILDASPVFQAFAKKGTKPKEYFKEPLPITANAVKKQKEQEAKQKMLEIKTKMIAFAEEFNKRFFTDKKEVETDA